MNQSFYVGALGATGSMEKMSVISNNIANVNTNGFKPKTAVFSDLLNYNLNDTAEAVTDLQAGNGVRVERTYTNFDTAAMVQTNSQYDYGILDKNSFFMIQDPITSEVSYTKDGHFHRAEREDGFYLMTASGKMVLDQNQEPIVLEVLDVEKIQAEMEENYEAESEEIEDEDKQKVSLYTFANPSRLLSAGNNEYVPADQSMEPVLVENPRMVSNTLEASGTDLAKELARLIECQNAFSYALKMVTTSDEIEGTINSLRG